MFAENRTEPTASNDPTKVKLRKPFVVCVLGASRGIGAGISYAYAKAGASGIVLASRRLDGLEETATHCKQLNSSTDTQIVSCDITSAESVAALADKIKEHFGRLDVAIINSGYSGQAQVKVTEADPAQVQASMDVNYIGTYYAAKYIIPILLSTVDGMKAFIATTSLAALIIRGPLANTKYCVSKLAQMRLVEMIHYQYHREGLSAYTVHPGSVETDLAKDAAPGMGKEFLSDSPDLCGAFCVWSTTNTERLRWMSGRMMNANWDVDQLEPKKDEIVERDLMKLTLTV